MVLSKLLVFYGLDCFLLTLNGFNLSNILQLPFTVLKVHGLICVSVKCVYVFTLPFVLISSTIKRKVLDDFMNLTLHFTFRVEQNIIRFKNEMLAKITCMLTLESW